MTPWIRTADELAAFVESLAGSRVLAIDTESDSLYHHREKVCLIQLAPEGRSVRLVDPLAFSDLSALAAVLADRTVVKVAHGAEYDVATLKRDFGFRFAGLLDTMIVARFLGLGVLGLQALLRAELGVEIDKGSQKDDWSRRPLDPQQEAYAMADVEHLVALAATLGARLQAAGRLAWAREECDAVAALPAASRRANPDAYQTLPGAADLTPRGLAVLRELHAWRARLADVTDTPPFKLLGNATLVAMAAAPPRASEDLARVTGAARLSRHAPELLEAVGHALALAEADLPRIARGLRPRVSSAVRARIDVLKRLREREATRLGLEPAFLLPRRLIDRVAETPPTTLEDLSAIEGFRRWRIEAVGPALLDLVA